MTTAAMALSSKLSYDYRYGEVARLESDYSASSGKWSSIKEAVWVPATQWIGSYRVLKASWSSLLDRPDADPEVSLFARIFDYHSLPSDWDGYEGEAASIETVMDAFRFLSHFPSTLPQPKPMVGGSGVIGLYWEGNGFYASIDFDGTGFYCYIADSPNEEGGDDAVPVRSPLPQRLAEIIAATAE
jgi:hypothetical protein